MGVVQWKGKWSSGKRSDPVEGECVQWKGEWSSRKGSGPVEKGSGPMERGSSGPIEREWSSQESCLAQFSSIMTVCIYYIFIAESDDDWHRLNCT
jgi:hypothetical protein